MAAYYEVTDSLNEKNLFTEYGLIIQTGKAKFLEFPERKEGVVNDWYEMNGVERDYAHVRFKEKEVVLNCAFYAPDDATFWQHYNAFFAEITQGGEDGWQDLFVQDHGKTYKVAYKKTANFEFSSKRLKEVSIVFVKFRLSLITRQ